MTKKTLKNGFGLGANKDETATDENKLKTSSTFKDSFDLGENGTATDIKTWLHNEDSTDATIGDIISLYNGAMSALRNHNRPEAIQMLEDQLKSFITCGHNSKTITTDELILLYQDLSEEKRQEISNRHLVQSYSIITNDERSKEELVKKLIKSGADVATDNQFILRVAARDSKTDLVTFLYEHGADFDKAILHARKSEDTHTLNNLQFYQRGLTGKIANYSPESVSTNKAPLELQRNVRDITGQNRYIPKKYRRRRKKVAQRSGHLNHPLSRPSF
jgi:hypothetical protein